MSNTEAGAATPNYGATPASAPSDLSSAQDTRSKTGFGFFKTIYGLLNIVILIALICVIICAGASNGANCKDADNYPKWATKVKVSAYHTRGAVLAFAVIGLILMLLDTIFHVTGLIKRFPESFDKIFIITMLVLAGVYFILGCCAAAWEQKMKDTVNKTGNYKRKGSAGAASFFVFATMAAVLANFILRLIRSGKRAENT